MPKAVEQKTAMELFEAAPCGYLFTDPDGIITRVNQTFLHLTGYTNADLVGRKSFQELLSIPAKIFYETHFAPLLRMQGYVKEITVDIVCANGTTIPALVNSTIQPDASGNPAFIRTTIFDIRERRRYERELLKERQKAEQLACVVQDASDAIITVAADDLRIETWNRGAETLFGYTAKEVIGRNIRELLVPKNSATDFQSQLATLRSGKSLHYETLRLNRVGEQVAVSVTATPQINPPDEFVGISLIMRDVRARNQAEEAQQSLRDLELVNRLAHEINNPLQAVMNCLAILSAEGNSEYVRLAELQTARVAQVLLDLLKVTRPD